MTLKIFSPMSGSRGEQKGHLPRAAEFRGGDGKFRMKFHLLAKHKKVYAFDSFNFGSFNKMK